MILLIQFNRNSKLGLCETPQLSTGKTRLISIQSQPKKIVGVVVVVIGAVVVVVVVVIPVVDPRDIPVKFG